MPRLYRNESIMSGLKVLEVLEYLGNGHGNEHIDFGRVVEYPKQFKEMDDRAAAFAHEFDKIQNRYVRLATRSQKIYHLTQKYGVSPETLRLRTGLESGGYEWQLENWGSSNPENLWIRTVRGDVGWLANLSFITEGGAPTRVFQKLSEIFPDVGIWLIYHEAWSKMEGHTRFHSGKMLFSIRSKGFPLIISK